MKGGMKMDEIEIKEKDVDIEINEELKTIRKKKRGRPKKETTKQNTISFSEVRKYLKGLDFEKNYGHYVYGKDIINAADENNAPENIINLLLKLGKDDTFYHYFEIQEALNKIQQPPKLEEKKITPLELIQGELNKQKEVCASKEKRISNLEESIYFWKKVGWGFLYSLLILLPITLLYLHVWVTIASDGRYNLYTFDLTKNATGWLISSDALLFLSFIMIALYTLTYVFLGWLWYICWDENGESE